jgi:hypothetical protein
VRVEQQLHLLPALQKLVYDNDGQKVPEAIFGSRATSLELQCSACHQLPELRGPSPLLELRLAGGSLQQLPESWCPFLGSLTSLEFDSVDLQNANWPSASAMQR